MAPTTWAVLYGCRGSGVGSQDRVASCSALARRSRPCLQVPLPPYQPVRHAALRFSLGGQIEQAGRPQLVREVYVLCLLALVLRTSDRPPWVAACDYVTVKYGTAGRQHGHFGLARGRVDVTQGPNTLDLSGSSTESCVSSQDHFPGNDRRFSARHVWAVKPGRGPE